MRSGLPRAGEEVEVEGGVQLVWPQVADEPLRVRHPDLAHEHARLGVGVGDRAPPAVDVVQLVPVGERVLAGGARRILLGEQRILDEQGRRVDAHARDAAVEPEAQHVLVLEPHLGMRPVEVGLLGSEQVQVPLAGRAGSPPCASRRSRRRSTASRSAAARRARPCRGGTRSARARATRAARPAPRGTTRAGRRRGSGRRR